MTKLNILISGMHCEACVGVIREDIKALPGVRACEVRVGQAEVSFDAEVTAKADLLNAIRASGSFEVRGFSTTECRCNS